MQAVNSSISPVDKVSWLNSNPFNLNFDLLELVCHFKKSQKNYQKWLHYICLIT